MPTKDTFSANKKTNRFNCFFSVFLAFGLLAALQSGGCQHPPEYVKIIQMPTGDEKRCEFSRLPLDKQIDFHLLAMAREPPDIQLGLYISQQGKAALPKVLERFEQEKEDYRKAYFIEIFEAMADREINFKEEANALERIKAVAAKMTAPTWKEIAEKDIRRIESTKFAARAEPLPPPCRDEPTNLN